MRQTFSAHIRAVAAGFFRWSFDPKRDFDNAAHAEAIVGALLIQAGGTPLIGSPAVCKVRENNADLPGPQVEAAAKAEVLAASASV